MTVVVSAIPQASLQRTSVGGGAVGARQSLKLMRGIILRYRYHPLLIAYARQIVNSSGIRQKDYPAQVQAVFNWIRNNIAFVRDPRGIDLYMTPDVILRTGAGDCDDFVILFCTFMEALGHPTGLMAVQQPGYDTFNHVVAITRIGTKWVCADTTENYALGYCPPSLNRIVVYV